MTITKNVYYSGQLNYWNPLKPGTEVRTTSGVGWGNDSLEAVYKDLYYYLKYYDDLGYEIKEYKISKYCKDCNGSGIVFYGKRVRRHKDCPSCKGKPELEIIEQWSNWKNLK